MPDTHPTPEQAIERFIAPLHPDVRAGEARVADIDARYAEGDAFVTLTYWVFPVQRGQGAFSMTQNIPTSIWFGRPPAPDAGPRALMITAERTGRGLVAPEDCDHHAGWCNCGVDTESSGCSGCGMTRPRAVCGEDGEQTDALDRLDVTIREHPMADTARQWRLIAADLITELTNLGPASTRYVDDMLARVREQHDTRTIIPKD